MAKLFEAIACLLFTSKKRTTVTGTKKTQGATKRPQQPKQKVVDTNRYNLVKTTMCVEKYNTLAEEPFVDPDNSDNLDFVVMKDKTSISDETHDILVKTFSDALTVPVFSAIRDEDNKVVEKKYSELDPDIIFFMFSPDDAAFTNIFMRIKNGSSFRVVDLFSGMPYQKFKDEYNEKHAKFEELKIKGKLNDAKVIPLTITDRIWCNFVFEDKKTGKQEDIALTLFKEVYKKENNDEEE